MALGFAEGEYEPVALGDIADDVKAEAHPVRVTCAGFASAERRFQYACAVCLRDAGAVVDHIEEPSAAVTTQHHRNVAACVVVADRVL